MSDSPDPAAGAPAKPTTTFQDAQGDTWTIRLNPVLIKEIRQRFEIDLVNLSQPDWLLKMAADVVLWADVLWSLIEHDAAARNVNIMAFADRIDGDTLDGALTALEGAIIDFFPSRQRPVVTAALAKVDEGFRRSNQTVLRAIEGLDVDKLAAIDEAKLKEIDLVSLGLESPPSIRSNSATDSPDASASNPTDEHSESSSG